MTTTVYHFGISEDKDIVTAFAYRSTNGFTPERLPHGFGIKPGTDVPEGDSVLPVIEQMVRNQRAEQDALPAAERIYIGGQVICMHLTVDDCKTSKLF